MLLTTPAFLFLLQSALVAKLFSRSFQFTRLPLDPDPNRGDFALCFAFTYTNRLLIIYLLTEGDIISLPPRL